MCSLRTPCGSDAWKTGRTRTTRPSPPEPRVPASRIPPIGAATHALATTVLVIPLGRLEWLPRTSELNRRPQRKQRSEPLVGSHSITLAYRLPHQLGCVLDRWCASPKVQNAGLPPQWHKWMTGREGLPKQGGAGSPAPVHPPVILRSPLSPTTRRTRAGRSRQRLSHLHAGSEIGTASSSSNGE